MSQPPTKKKKPKHLYFIITPLFGPRRILLSLTPPPHTHTLNLSDLAQALSRNTGHSLMTVPFIHSVGLQWTRYAVVSRGVRFWEGEAGANTSVDHVTCSSLSGWIRDHQVHVEKKNAPGSSATCVRQHRNQEWQCFRRVSIQLNSKNGGVGVTARWWGLPLDHSVRMQWVNTQLRVSTAVIGEFTKLCTHGHSLNRQPENWASHKNEHS